MHCIQSLHAEPLGELLARAWDAPTPYICACACIRMHARACVCIHVSAWLALGMLKLRVAALRVDEIEASPVEQPSDTLVDLPVQTPSSGRVQGTWDTWGTGWRVDLPAYAFERQLTYLLTYLLTHFLPCLLACLLACACHRAAAWCLP